MKRWTNKREMLRQQAQLVGARRDRTKARLRPEVASAPPSHVPPEQEDTSAQPSAAPATKQPRPRVHRDRAQQPQDVLGKLLHNDQTSHELAQQLWWKWRQVYLPAKQAELQRRRGAAPAATVDDDAV